jgi:hypothetical protein
MKGHHARGFALSQTLPVARLALVMVILPRVLARPTRVFEKGDTDLCRRHT